MDGNKFENSFSSASILKYEISLPEPEFWLPEPEEKWRSLHSSSLLQAVDSFI